MHDVVDRALQAHGALGYSTDLPLEQMYRYERSARIYDGPGEVHRQSVARRILNGYAAPAERSRATRAPSTRPSRAAATRMCWIPSRAP
jgi:acyl-CoA dehydrogenase